MSSKERKSQAPSSTEGAQKFPVNIFLGGLFVRLAILSLFYSSLPALQTRIELVTPVTNIKSIKEGLFLFEHGFSPYEGAAYRQTPLYLWLFSGLLQLPDVVVYLIYIALDLFGGYMLWKIGTGYLPRAFKYVIRDTTEITLPKDSKYSPKPDSPQLTLDFDPKLLPAAYLFSPYTLLSCFSLSTAIFNNTAILAAILAAVNCNLVLAMAFLSLATHISLFPVTLFLPLYLVIFPNDKRINLFKFIGAMLLFGFFLGVFTFLAVELSGSLQYAHSVYGTLIWIRDLTPNVGLFWYFFIEMFRQFRTYFLLAFLFIHAFISLPLSYRFSDHPMIPLVVQLGLAAIYKSYPSLADAGLYMAMVPIFSGLYPYMTKYVLIIGFLIANAALGPVFWHAWIIYRSANANFFFATTLLYGVAHTLLLIDIIQAYRKFDFLTRHPRLKLKAVELL
ncbi:hypothetical protein DSO57_1004467 [Entomophthora muscae]|uniref:Uncharacterized protein n=2 Tax=Entomophthora muscae TaxID=34485 RepID=A0ACC2UHM0_9FUNG|nr:hypothetical protein DSO57_1004467 [Entomophthora muscae]